MDFFIKTTYSVLFGVLIWLLFLIFSESIENKRKLEIGCLVILTSILAINTFSIAPHFVPANKIWELIAFDFSIPVLHVLMQRRSPATRNNSVHVLNDSISSLRERKMRRTTFLKALTVMLYTYQLVSLWLLTKQCELSIEQ